MKRRHFYTTRSNAIRAARQHCRRVIGPYYEAKEGPDFGIHNNSILDPEFSYELRGPAKEIDEGRATHKDGYLIHVEGA